MDEKQIIIELHKLASKLTLLYVEDNKGLQKQAVIMFERFFSKVYIASDGEEGLSLFKKHHPDIIVSDIEMPKMNGLDMAEAIKKIDPMTKIIITSAYDDKEYLRRSIDIGITHYITKPMPINALSKLLLECVKKITDEKNKNLFEHYMQKLFTNSTDLILLFEGKKLQLVNEQCLSFFDTEDLDTFKSTFEDLGDFLLPNENFLYNNDTTNWFDEAIAHPEKPFHTKIANPKGKMNHFILKLYNAGDNRYIISLNDITELGLLKLFDTQSPSSEKINQKEIKKLFEVVKQNNIEIKVHNFYKGLSIVHPGKITEVEPDGFTLKSNYMQLKAIQYEKKVLLSCDIFPVDFESSDIKKIDFNNNSVFFGIGHILDKSPTMREAVRIQPSSDNYVNLYYDKHTFNNEIEVLDISIQSIRLRMPFIPSGLKEDDLVKLEIKLEIDKNALLIKADGKVYTKVSYEHNFEVVLTLSLSSQMHSKLVDYISKRQRSLIREFKSMQFGD